MTGNILKEVIGLTELEVKTYFVLHNLGVQPASIIARKTGCPRSSIYAVLEKLMKEGLVTYTIRNGVKYFNSVCLKTLDKKLKDKQSQLNKDIEKIKKNRSKLKEYLKCANKKEEKIFLNNKPKVQIFKGQEGIKSLCSMVEKPQKNTLKMLIGQSNQLDNKAIKKLVTEAMELEIMTSDPSLIKHEAIIEQKNITVTTLSNMQVPHAQTAVILSPKRYIYIVFSRDGLYGLLINDARFIQNQFEFFRFLQNQQFMQLTEHESCSQYTESS